MHKDIIVNALKAIQNGVGSCKFHKELQVAIGIIMGTSQDDIAAVVQDIDEDKVMRSNLVLLNALDAAMGGAATDDYWEEFVTIRTVLANAPIEAIAAATEETDKALEEALKD